MTKKSLLGQIKFQSPLKFFFIKLLLFPSSWCWRCSLPTYQRKNGSQHNIKTPMMMPKVRAALCSARQPFVGRTEPPAKRYTGKIFSKELVYNNYQQEFSRGLAFDSQNLIPQINCNAIFHSSNSNWPNSKARKDHFKPRIASVNTPLNLRLWTNRSCNKHRISHI